MPIRPRLPRARTDFRAHAMAARLRPAVLAACLLVPGVATAVPSCPTDDHRAELHAFEERLRGADSLEEAQELALDEVEQSRKAVQRATRLVPGDAELRATHADLEAFADGVAAAQSRGEVADRFATLRGQQTAANCHYSTGEVIAIVLGFILGVLPGIILLILLC